MKIKWFEDIYQKNDPLYYLDNEWTKDISVHENV